MRDIKFRMFDTEIKQMLFADMEQLMHGYNDLRAQYFDTDTPSIMQFTGFKDKNGVEIYEGDIVKYSKGISHWDDSYSKPTLVEFNNGSFHPFCGCGGEYSMDIGNTEVIGNIHENPELLENKS